jgi:D-alanyl-D-alanine carboxypeptidase
MFAFLLVAALACPDAARVRALEVRLQRAVDSVLAANATANAVALHVDAPGACLTRTFVAGFANPAAKTPFTPATPVRMASNTKTYVAAATLRLVEDGTIGLDDPIAKHLGADYVAALAAGGYDAKAITVRHLLSHTSGLFDYAMSEPFQQAVTASPTHRWTRMEQVRFAAEKGKPYGAPGETFHYSDTGYILLGEIVERVSGKPLATALRQLIGYDKLGLRTTWLETLEPVPPGAPERAHQFFGAADTFGWDPSLDLYGGGGLAAPVGEMAAFTRGLMTGKVFKRPATLRTMTETVVDPKQTRYHLGISSREDEGVTGFGHSGFWNTFSAYYPAIDLAIAGSVSQQQLRGYSQAVVRETILALRAATNAGH